MRRSLAIQRLERRELLAVDALPAVSPADDVNGDGAISVADIQLVFLALQKDVPDSAAVDLLATDVNRNGRTTALDALHVVNVLAIEDWLVLLKGDLNPDFSIPDAAQDTIKKYEPFLDRVRSVLDREIDVTHAYRVAIDGLVMHLSQVEAQLIQSFDSVVSINRPNLFEQQTDAGPQWINADTIWTGTATTGGIETRGEGTIIGVLDSGIDYDNASFAATGPVDGYVHVNPLGMGNFLGMCDPSNAGFDASVACNDKLIGVYDFTSSTTVNDETAADHGTHTASIAAGNVLDVPFPDTAETVTISGVAPHANVIAYDVCRSDTLCYEPEIVSAIDQAIMDDVDVINFSIGNFPTGIFTAVPLAFLNARDNGIFVAVSAMNTGPNPSTIGVPAAAPWLTPVANVWHNRVVDISLDVTGPAPVPANLERLSYVLGENIVINSDIGPAAFVDAAVVDPLNHEGCSAFAADSFLNAIALINRGTCFFVDKVQNAEAAGAIAVVVADNQPGLPLEMGGVDAAGIPSVFVTQDNGAALHDWIATNASATVRINSDVTIIFDDVYGDIVNTSSSRGPTSLFDVITPAVAAPGTNILAAVASDGADEWDLLTGTSMASPHVAGSAALLTALHPDWTPTEMQSALALTAVPAAQLLKEDVVSAADPFDVGSGRLDLSKASLAGFVLDELRANFAAANTLAESRALNLPSFNHSALTSSYSWTRTLRSTRSTAVTWTPSFAAPPGMVVEVSPSVVSLAAGATETITVTADFIAPPVNPTEWLFADIVLTPDDSEIPDAHFPIAVKWDDDTLGVVIVEKSITEGDGPLTAQVFRTSDTTNALTVDLASSDTLQLGVDSSVTIAAGQVVSPLFSITVVDDAVPDGIHDVTITASATGLTDGTDQIEVFDDDAPQIESVVVNRGDGQRSIVDEVVVTFDAIVEIDESTGPALEIIDRGSLEAVKLDPKVTEDTGKTVVTISFLTGPSVELRNALPVTLADGNFQLNVFAARIHVGNLALDGDGNGEGGDDYSFGDNIDDDFFRHFGDSDGDRFVGISELFNFGDTYLVGIGEPNYDPTFDFGGNNFIGITALFEFGDRYLQSLTF